MFRSKIFLRIPLILGLVVMAIAFSGCESSSDDSYVFTTRDAPAVAPAVAGVTLTVNPNIAPRFLPRISAVAVNLRVTLYNTAGQQVAERTVPRGTAAIFTNLAPGFYLVRTVGLDLNGAVIGYFDLSVAVQQDVAVEVPALLYTNLVPNTTTPSQADNTIHALAFNILPDMLTGGEAFNLAVTAYDANGQVLTSAAGTVTLTVSGAVNQPLGNRTFTNGVASFNGLQLPALTNGNVSFQAMLGGQTVTTPAIPVAAGTILEPGTVLPGTFLTVFPWVGTRAARAPYFPGFHHYWDLYQAFAIGDGRDDLYDGGGQLRVGPEAGPAVEFNTSSGDVSFNELSWLTPLFGTGEGLIAGTVIPPGTSGFDTPTNAAFLAPGKENRIQQTLNLTGAVSPINLSWVDQISLGVFTSYEVPGMEYRVVIRSTNGTLLQTLYNRTDYGSEPRSTRNADLSAYAGQTVVLSFEVLNAQAFLFNNFYFDDVQVLDNNLTNYVTNGQFDTGDLTGWTTYVEPTSHHVRSPVRNHQGLEVQRTMYAPPNTNWARFYDQFTNNTQADITVRVELYTNLGSDGNETFHPANNGTGTVLVTSDNNTGGDDDLGFAFGNGFTLESGSNSGQVLARGTLTVPAGQTRALVSFLSQSLINSGGNEPTTLLNQMVTISNNFRTDPSLLRGLTEAEYNAIVNF